MKKTLIAFAVLSAFAATASAQSSVTIYGSIDAGIRDVTNVDAAGNSKVTMGSNGTYNSNRLGFKGVEDLGGGMNAHFVLESGFNTATGTLDSGTMFNRSAFVGVTGDFGNIDLGRQYSLAFKTIGTYEPFSYKFPAITSPVAGVALFFPATFSGGGATRFNNDIQYTAIFSGVKVSAEYALGEVAGDIGRNTVKSVAATYTTGPVNFGGTFMSTDVGGLRNKYYTVGGAYKEGVVRVSGGYVKETQESVLNIDSYQKSFWGGINYTITPQIELTGAYYVTDYTVATSAATKVDGSRKNLVVAATYALSKRTNFYVEVDNKKLTNAFVGATAVLGTINNGTQNGFSVGITHLF
ncbi:porin [Undibacterium sp. 5I1]|uniref:porin n=1 Tax=unclassified Undibacterium TaxID=2630295 RepID=UPI002AB59723|nr:MULTISPECIES: porin [unclassified Undibacterium]MDY7539217.1 porin [Undibacterium sp. 5I1]MEB0231111.1 porin [Undibacterium sp. 10I3]MEB0256984.1 porin [Undibacterium sp. 5I1]